MWAAFTRTGKFDKHDQLKNAEANLLRIRSFRYLDNAKEIGIDELTVSIAPQCRPHCA